jgi:hypothetical protein
LEPRLGTKSMYMRPNVIDLQRLSLSHADALHGYIVAPRSASPLDMPVILAFRRQNFGLVECIEVRGYPSAGKAGSEEQGPSAL